MEKSKKKTQQRERRHGRIRAQVSGTPECPRLAVFRSNKYISVQLIDDTTGTTLGAATSKGAKDTSAKAVGKEIAEAAKQKNITSVVFDRGGFLYTGKVAELAEGAREGGLTF